MTIYQVNAIQKNLDQLASLIPCCACKTKGNLYVDLSGSASGASVSLTANVNLPGGTCPFYILGYFWWNCVSAQHDASAAGVNVGHVPDQEWQIYGYYGGGPTKTATDNGSNTLLDFLDGDAGHWNWQVLVMYLHCGPDHFMHVSLLGSDQMEYTWSTWHSAWTGPVPASLN